jgi:hypothetical protein
MRKEITLSGVVVKPGDSVLLPPEGMIYMNEIEIKGKPRVTDNDINFPVFGVNDDKGNINLMLTKLELKGTSLKSLTISNPNQEVLVLSIRTVQL